MPPAKYECDIRYETTILTIQKNCELNGMPEIGLATPKPGSDLVLGH